MKKAFMLSSMVGMGIVAYVLINKETRKRAEKVINTMLDEANSMMIK